MNENLHSSITSISLLAFQGPWNLANFFSLTSVNFIPGFTTLATAAAVGDMAASSSSDNMAPEHIIPPISQKKKKKKEQ